MFVITVDFEIKNEYVNQFRSRVLQQAKDSLNNEEKCLIFDVCFDKKNCSQANEAALIIENAIEEGFNKNLLRPFEFGGDMSTTEITSQILNLIK